MKTIKLLLLFLFAFTLNPAFSQRELQEIVSSDSYPFTGTAVFDSKTFIAEQYTASMYSFDGSNNVEIDFPLRGPNQLYFSGGDLIVLENSIYMLLTSNGLDTYLYKFNGSDFTEISVPDWPWEILLFKDKIYIMTEASFGYIQLYSFDGDSIAPVGPDLPNSTIFYTFEVEGDYLYFGGVDYNIDVDRIVLRYDGSNLIDLPLIGSYEIYDLVGIPETEIVFLNIGRSIIKFDGLDFTNVYTAPSGSTFTSFLEWQGEIYFQVNFPASSGSVPVLFRYDGKALNPVSLPTGNQLIPLAEGVVYENDLFIPVKFSTTTEGVIRFNGTSFSDFFLFPETTSAPKLFERGEALVIIPQRDNSDTVYVFEEDSFTEIAADPGTTIHSYLTGLDCFHLWNTFDGASYAASKETVCAESASIIPEHFRNFQKVEFAVAGKYRDWCWTDILFDWTINPICPVPEVCPDPIYETTLTSLKGKVAFQEKFDQPFQIDFPLPDNQSYMFKLSTHDNNMAESLIILDNNMVAKGFSEVRMTIAPSEDYFKLEVSTDNDKQLPFDLKLLNSEGKTVWTQRLTAPFNAEIEAVVPAPGGTTLQISSVSKDIKDLKDYGIAEVNYYPNPFAGKLEVDISTLGTGNVPLTLSVFNLEGEKIIEKEITAPMRQQVNLEGQKEGIYIIQLKTGDAVFTDFMILKY